MMMRRYKLFTEYNFANKDYCKMTIEIRKDDVKYFFHMDLPAKKQYPIRKGQVDMALDIVEAMSENANLMIEAGVGIRKSLPI